jgi:acetylglutamate kinase
VSNPILIKIGGRAAERAESLDALATEMAEVSRHSRLVLVHGGGAQVTALSRRLGMEAVFKDGVRQTSPEEMDVVDMVLGGKINKQLVRMLRARGLDAVGLSGSDGGIFTGEPLGGAGAGTRTGDVRRIEARLLTLLLGNGFLPVLCSTSMDGQGLGLNINADTVAFRLAAHLKAAALVFFSDTPGILCDGSVVKTLTSGESLDLIARGVVSGGMVPKVRSSLEALEQGVQKVIIGEYDAPGALARLLDGRQGSRLWK